MQNIRERRIWASGLVLAVFWLSAGYVRSGENKAPMLWQIEGKTPSYLFGTIHLPDDRLLKLHPAVDKALMGAQQVFTEIPMDMNTQMKLAMMSMLPDGKTLKDVLPAKLYTRTERAFAEKSLPMFALTRFKVWAIAVQVMLIDRLMELATKTPLDKFLYQKAEAAGIKVAGIETPQEQIDVFDSLSLKEQIKTLKEALDKREENKKKGIDPFEEMLNIYLQGDLDQLQAKMKEEYDPNDPLMKKMWKRLFTDRNIRMTQRIQEKIKAAPDQSFFFAIGAGHMPGKQGIVQLLRKAGLKVVRVKS